ncbi:hypothetical protein FB45DRAFT_941547 [Roridomyces roridus]|uniref:Uncharacterized protein n=1 Tax=Roridomyces roridus TaxID=1738132 RepID=A0AAD7B6D0_9AGAR|nr:hypothetical protein FB45DRAFT_941547 [Roridomyces roridus]
MGSYTSTLNDTSSTVYITYAPNKVGLEILYDFINALASVDWSEVGAEESLGTVPSDASKLAASATHEAASATHTTSAAHAASATTAPVTVDSFIASVAKSALSQGYHAVPAGNSYVSEKLTLSLVHQADVIMAQSITGVDNMVIVYKGSFTVWSGSKDGSTKHYNLSSQVGSLQKQVFEIINGTVVAVPTPLLIAEEHVAIQKLQAQVAARINAAAANAEIAHIQAAIAAQ